MPSLLRENFLLPLRSAALPELVDVGFDLAFDVAFGLVEIHHLLIFSPIQHQQLLTIGQFD